jgi:hypothetical protein
MTNGELAAAAAAAAAVGLGLITAMSTATRKDQRLLLLKVMKPTPQEASNKMVQEQLPASPTRQSMPYPMSKRLQMWCTVQPTRPLSCSKSNRSIQVQPRDTNVLHRLVEVLWLVVILVLGLEQVMVYMRVQRGPTKWEAGTTWPSGVKVVVVEVV